MQDKKFEKWLVKNGFKPRTIYGYGKHTQFFNDWCESNAVSMDKATVNDLYDFVDFYRQRDQFLTAKKIIGTLKHYYKCIGRSTNPALVVVLEKREKTLPRNLLTEEEILALYMSVIPRTIVRKRNKVMLGLVAFQGLKNDELSLIDVDDIDFKNRFISIPKTDSSNARNVPLKEYQIHELQTYIYEIRPLLLLQARQDTTKLFFSTKGTASKLKNIVNAILQDLQANVSYFKSFEHLRFSRMSLWVSEFGVRKAQYLSGIKYPTSMLRYEKKKTEDLVEKLKKIHPMERLGV